jgi:hypothetical protein
VKDSDGVYRRTRLSAMTLGWSRKAVWLLSMSSSATVWSTLHEKAFRQLGGTPKVIVLDNLKEGVKDVDYCDPTINLEYAQVLRHYDVEPCQRSVVLQMLPAEHRLQSRNFAAAGDHTSGGQRHPVVLRGSTERRSLKSRTTCQAVAKEHEAWRATSATLSSGALSSTVHTSARQVGPMRSRFR